MGPIERSLSIDCVPTDLRTLGKLFQNGSTFDPFSAVEISSWYNVTPELVYEWDGPLNQRQNAAWTLTMIRKHGRAEASRIIRKENRDSKKLFALLDSILAEMAVPVPTQAELTSTFQESFSAQLFGLSASLNGLFVTEEPGTAGL